MTRPEGSDNAGCKTLSWAFARLTRGLRAYAIIALLSLAATLPGVFSTPPLDRDESRYAQATVQMLETRDFVRILEQDQPRNKKPIGSYWLQAASVALFSTPGARAIWAYRLPSVLAAVVAALATLWAGAALFNRKVGFLSGALLASCVLLSTEGMIAKTDATLCAATAMAMAALAQIYLGRGTLPQTLSFWGAVGIGILVKGPITPMVVSLSLVTLALWERRAAWMKPLLRPSGPALALLLTLPWFVSIELATHGQFLRDALTGDLGRKLGGADEGHAAPPGYYLALLPILAFPISTGLPAGIAQAWVGIRNPVTDAPAAMRFLVAWAAPTWLVFELLPTKLPHYPLPAYPALALLAAAGLCAQTARPAGRWLRLILFALALFAFLLIVAFIGAVERNEVAAALIATAIALVAFIAYARTHEPHTSAYIAVATAIAFAILTRGILLPGAGDWFVSSQASATLERGGLHPRLSAHAGRLIAVGYSEPSFVFLTRTDTLLATPDEAAAVAWPNSAMIVEGRQRVALDRALAQHHLIFAPVGEQIRGFDYSNHTAVVLQPGRIFALVND